MPQAEAASAGLMFGKGIYLTDQFGKAAGACKGDNKYVLVVEAALGDIFHATQPTSELPKFYHSLKGNGKLAPAIKGLKDLN